MMIVAFLCFIALIAAWFIAPKEMTVPEVAPIVKSVELTAPAVS
ncbi:MAG TPA: hypothetical protein VIL85_29370 [Thermomicrobiales bacterium]|jgi:hypothetical protein